MQLTIHYKPDNYPYWVLWREFSSQEIQMIGRPSQIDLGGVPIARAGFKPRISFGKPGNDCDPNTGRILRRGYMFQVKIAWIGHAVIDRFRLHAQKQTERSISKC